VQCTFAVDNRNFARNVKKTNDYETKNRRQQFPRLRGRHELTIRHRNMQFIPETI
jgi:hypothetical protein